ncbi:MAG: undecaprenyldiphospho-muramoylpentapeptide beta-N-acetylglucosaminyltransferase [Firmicutes bacterium]|nr:undecaprenyldiphospho-muramoylpentapeptide beta-N-acetylglucosaminyltransferase [Bacillota bacterium]
MKVIMTCGGTGGHIYPAVAIADELKRRDGSTELLFIGSEIGMEKDLIPQSGYEITLISADGFSRTLRGSIRSVKRVLKGRGQAKKLIADFQPDLVIGTGGYASAPVVSAAQRKGIPTYIQEQNAIPGKTNKFLGRRARKIFLGFEKAGDYFKDRQRLVLTGNPVRKEFSDLDRETIRRQLGIPDNAFVVLAFGGSQGAGRLNREMLQVIERYNGEAGTRIWLGAGSYYYDAIQAELKEKGLQLQDNIMISEYIHDMSRRLAASDLVISRSGALTVAEVSVCGVPAIFIPFPDAAENHQYYNAMAIAEKGGAIVIEEKDLDQKPLTGQIEKLRADRRLWEDMAQGCRACGAADAVKVICDTILEDFRK